MEVKTCAACGVTKKITNFTVSGRDGYRNKRCKLCVNNGRASVPPSELRMCKCCSENKPLSEFYRNSTYSNGYETRCKTCKKAGLTIPKDKLYDIEDNSEAYQFKISHLTEEDYLDTYRTLQAIGYDIHSQKTIHQQFCEKYNLRPKKRKTILDTRFDKDEMVKKIV
jgi:hypothetical protein